jgi:hypothetical protein
MFVGKFMLVIVRWCIRYSGLFNEGEGPEGELNFLAYDARRVREEVIDLAFAGWSLRCYLRDFHR